MQVPGGLGTYSASGRFGTRHHAGPSRARPHPCKGTSFVEILRTGHRSRPTAEKPASRVEVCEGFFSVKASNGSAFRISRRIGVVGKQHPPQWYFTRLPEGLSSAKTERARASGGRKSAGPDPGTSVARPCQVGHHARGRAHGNHNGTETLHPTSRYRAGIESAPARQDRGRDRQLD